MSGPTPRRQLLSICERLKRLASETVHAAHAEALYTHAQGLLELSLVVAPKAPPNALTPAQARVLAFVRLYLEQYGKAPTRKEIAEALSYASPTAAQDHLKALERKGHLVRTSSEPRALRLTPT